MSEAFNRVIEALLNFGTAAALQVWFAPAAAAFFLGWELSAARKALTLAMVARILVMTVFVFFFVTAIQALVTERIAQ